MNFQEAAEVTGQSPWMISVYVIAQGSFTQVKDEASMKRLLKRLDAIKPVKEPAMLF